MYGFAFRYSWLKVCRSGLRVRGNGGSCCLSPKGLITTIFGIALLFIVPEDPSKSRILNDAERRLAMQRIDAEQIVKTQGKKEKTALKLVLRSFNFMVSASLLSGLIRQSRNPD